MRLVGDASVSSRVERVGSGRDAYLLDVALVERKAKTARINGCAIPRQLEDSSATKNSRRGHLVRWEGREAREGDSYEDDGGDGDDDDEDDGDDDDDDDDVRNSSSSSLRLSALAAYAGNSREVASNTNHEGQREGGHNNNTVVSRLHERTRLGQPT